MLTVEEFDSLEVGDQIETAPLLPALTDDPVRRRMIWNSRSDFVADGLGSSGSGYAA